MLEEFIDAMRHAECAPVGQIMADDRVHNYKIQDGARIRNGRYQIKVTADYGTGWFLNYYTGELHKWHSKVSRNLSMEERQELRARLKAEEQAKDAARVEAEHAAAARALKIWRGCSAVGVSDYLLRKQVGSLGARFARGGVLVVPVWIDGALASLQYISRDGTKLFMKGGRLRGGYAAISEPSDDRPVIVICEGFATGATIRAATRWPVIVAFNAGNLEPVAKVIRGKYPDARIIIAADNDAWVLDPKKRPEGADTTQPGDAADWADWRVAGLLWNPGLEKARQAAGKVGAHVVWPEFDEADPAKPTDFNDLHCSLGLDAVKSRMSVVAPATAHPNRGGGEQDLIPLDHAPPHQDLEERDYELYAEPEHQETPIDRAPFVILGHNEGLYFFLSKESGQIVSMSAGSLAHMPNLYRLAPREYWQEIYGGDGKVANSKIADLACGHLTTICHQKKIFRARNIRGIGAWREDDKNVFHCGEYLFMKGEKISPYKFKSRFVYPQREAVVDMSDNHLGNKDASKLRDICGKLSWENPLSGELLAGWCVIAPVCAALPWRPHIWITGESQSGKSTVLNNIIAPIVGDIALRVDGGTTEPAIRQSLGYDGRPIIYDEAEAESQRDYAIMESVLALARRSSSGSTVIKGSSNGEAMEYTARSAFCFSGINPAIKHRADESRISQLVLRRDRGDGADMRYKEIKKMIKDVITPEYSMRLLARTFNNIDTLLSNIDIFSDAASEVLCDRRAADQIGALLAGLYLLTSTKPIKYDAAIEWIKKHNWDIHTAIAEQSDPERFISHLAVITLRYEENKHITEDTIGSLIKKSIIKNNIDATKALRNYGIWPRKEGIWIANKSPSLARLLRDTPWHTWSRTLKDLSGAVQNNPVIFAPGLNQRSVGIPYSAFDIDITADINEEPKYEEEIAWL